MPLFHDFLWYSGASSMADYSSLIIFYLSDEPKHLEEANGETRDASLE
jgi:hypothetical protein